MNIVGKVDSKMYRVRYLYDIYELGVRITVNELFLFIPDRNGYSLFAINCSFCFSDHTTACEKAIKENEIQNYRFILPHTIVPLKTKLYNTYSIMNLCSII